MQSLGVKVARPHERGADLRVRLREVEDHNGIGIAARDLVSLGVVGRQLGVVDDGFADLAAEALPGSVNISARPLP